MQQLGANIWRRWWQINLRFLIKKKRNLDGPFPNSVSTCVSYWITTSPWWLVAPPWRWTTRTPKPSNTQCLQPFHCRQTAAHDSSGDRLDLSTPCFCGTALLVRSSSGCCGILAEYWELGQYGASWTIGLKMDVVSVELQPPIWCFLQNHKKNLPRSHRKDGRNLILVARNAQKCTSCAETRRRLTTNMSVVTKLFWLVQIACRGSCRPPLPATHSHSWIFSHW